MTRRARARRRRRRLILAAAGILGVLAGAALDVLAELEDDAQRLAARGPLV